MWGRLIGFFVMVPGTTHTSSAACRWPRIALLTTLLLAVVLGGAATAGLADSAAAPNRAAEAVTTVTTATTLTEPNPDTSTTGAPAPCPTQASHPWCDTSMGAEQRAELFAQAMTLQQQIQFLGGDQSNNGHTGATYAVPSLGLRQIYLTDGPVGPRQGVSTAMPIPLALAATWSTAEATDYGNEVGVEARDKGNDFVFGPTVNLMRTPQGGRTYEAYGEDTYLETRTGVAWIQGAQSAGVIATVKHFVANEQEGQVGVPPVAAASGGRQLVNVNVSERTLREVYMPQFEAAVKQAHVGAVMCAYDRVNGVYSCENAQNLLETLRGEWGYKGVILSDYGASDDFLQNPGVSATADDLNHGLDFVPDEGSVDQSYSPALIETALLSGEVTAQTIRQHAVNLLYTLFSGGVFDRPGYNDNDAQIPVAKDQQTAETVEQRAIVLLKNDGILPLKPSVHSIAVIGPYANLFVTGGGSGEVSPRQVVTALQGIAARAGQKIKITYDDGYDSTEAAQVAQRAQVAVVVVGDVDSEGLDKSCIDLNCTPSDLEGDLGMAAAGQSPCSIAPQCPANGGNEDGLITDVAAAQPNTVVVLETSGPVLTPWRSQVAGMIEAWYPGQEGGIAIANVLFGSADPAGRLPVTFPESAAQLPTAGSTLQYPGVDEQEYYSEGLSVGYKWYEAHNFTPAYPFGYGLSYTSFRYSPVTLKLVKHNTNEIATASFKVTNTGKVSGYAVPELYVSKPATSALPQVPRQLAGYSSDLLRPGQTARVTIPLNDRTFASWGTSEWTITPGCYSFTLGTSSSALLSEAIFSRGASCPHAQARLAAATTAAEENLPLPPIAFMRIIGTKKR
jgi:beta-glucosidase